MSRASRFFALALLAPVLGRSAAVTLLSDSFDAVSISGSLKAQIASSEGNTYRILTGADVFSSPMQVAGCLSVSGSSNCTIFVSFPTFAFTRPGDSLTVTFTVQYPKGAANTAGSLRVGLYRFGEDLDITRGYDPDQNPSGDKAPGYFLVTNPGLEKPAGTALNKDLANQKAPIGANAVNSSVPGSAVWLKSGPGVAFGSSPHVISLTLTRTVSGVAFVGGPDGASAQSEDVSAAWTEFDAVVISNGASAGPYAIDDLVITAASAP